MAGTADGAADTLRQFNRQRVLAALRDLDAASRADLSRVTGLSRNTVASIVAELQRDGVLREAGRPGPRTTGPGRPASLLTLTPAAGLAVAVDVGNAHVRVAVGDATGEIAEERVRDLPEGLASADLLSAAREVVAEVVAAQELTAREVVGATLGLPAPIDRHGRTVTRRFAGLDLVEHSGLGALTDRIAIRNDADLCAIGEGLYGAARGIGDFVFVKVSHGLGAGLVLDRRPYHGSRGLAGNLGHVRVREDGDVCLCGNRGCLETLVSARALVAALQPAHPGRALTVADLFDLVREGDEGARVLVTDAGRVIGRSLGEIINMLNPAAIVVGGSLSALDEPLLAGVRESIVRYSQPAARVDLRVVRAETGERAAVLGGLALALGLVLSG